MFECTAVVQFMSSSEDMKGCHKYRQIPTDRHVTWPQYVVPLNGVLESWSFEAVQYWYFWSGGRNAPLSFFQAHWQWYFELAQLKAHTWHIPFFLEVISSRNCVYKFAPWSP